MRGRLIVAFALAIALHEIVLGLFRFSRPPHATEAPVPAQLVEIRIPPPTPRPRMTPRPTPRPTPVPPTPPPYVTMPPHVTPAPVRQVAGRAAGHPAKRRGGGAHAALAKATAGPYANPKAAGEGTGTSSGRGNAPGAGGGNGGNGTGQSGNGNGGVNADTPCGAVLLEPNGELRVTHGTSYEPIQAKVSFRDGHTETAMFPYKWVYPNAEQTDPWSETNLKRTDAYLIPLQTPPPGTDPATLPPLIQYILKHTKSDGTTDLPDCPSSAPHP
jgi:hypothetical protein